MVVGDWDARPGQREVNVSARGQNITTAPQRETIETVRDCGSLETPRTGLYAFVKQPGTAQSLLEHTPGAAAPSVLHEHGRRDPGARSAPAAWSEIVQAKLLLHVSFRQLSQRIASLLQEPEDGGQLLPPRPAEKKRRGGSSQAPGSTLSRDTAVRRSQEPSAGRFPAFPAAGDLPSRQEKEIPLVLLPLPSHPPSRPGRLAAALEIRS